jgi:hypothetical protein
MRRGTPADPHLVLVHEHLVEARGGHEVALERGEQYTVSVLSLVPCIDTHTSGCCLCGRRGGDRTVRPSHGGEDSLRR